MVTVLLLTVWYVYILKGIKFEFNIYLFTVLYFHLIINYYLNYFKIIILKVKKNYHNCDGMIV